MDAGVLGVLNLVCSWQLPLGVRMKKTDATHTASASAAGYLFQCRYALLAGPKAIPAAPELVVRTCAQRCLEMLGGLGLSRDYLPEKWLRGVRTEDGNDGSGAILQESYQVTIGRQWEHLAGRAARRSAGRVALLARAQNQVIVFSYAGDSH